MRVLICGDRDWTDRETIVHYMKTGLDPHNTVVIEGEAPGVDQTARLIATGLGIPVRSYPADWAVYNKGAGPIRNQQMIDDGHPDVVWAFHNNLRESKGTKDMVYRANAHGIPVVIFTSLKRG